MRWLNCLAISAIAASGVHAENPTPFDAAAAFGALPSVSDLRLSTDGKSVSYIGAIGGSSTALFTYDLTQDRPAVAAIAADGKPDRLNGCSWVSNDRLVCEIYGLVKNPQMGILPFTRMLALDRDGHHSQLLSNKTNDNTHGIQLGGGAIIDWLPEEDGAVLMTRDYLPDTQLGTRVGSSKEGLGVDHIDTLSLKTQPVEAPQINVIDYVSDGRGNIRIVGRTSTVQGGQATGIYSYSYRKQGSRDWLPLSTYNSIDGSGFRPVAVDHDRDVVFGFKKNDGRIAAYSVALDGSLQETLIYANPNVDVSNFATIGRRHRIVGVGYSTQVGHVAYFDPEVERLMRSLGKALGNNSGISLVDFSVDEQVMLVIASGDDEPGVYYIFDRRTKELKTFLVQRSALEGVKLAKMKPITYPAADGTQVPGYLTLPPGVDSPKGLPAIVLPHGGPGARDRWGFDWLSQFYAARGYAVLQPNFRGSAGYGDAWLKQNGFKSWRTAIGDVLDAGRWLIAQGIADPKKLCVVGWSYGGYAALQSAVTEPGFFKAVVAIAPVTDLAQLSEEWRHWSNFYLIKDEVGEGPHVREGSPARNADKIKVPVLLFHGTLDRNVSIMQSRTMDSRLEKAGVKHQLVTFDGLDHPLEDANARTEMLRKSDEWLQAAIAAAN
jgi:dienelactone hydrolase